MIREKCKAQSRRIGLNDAGSQGEGELEIEIVAALNSNTWRFELHFGHATMFHSMIEYSRESCLVFCCVAIRSETESAGEGGGDEKKFHSICLDRNRRKITSLRE